MISSMNSSHSRTILLGLILVCPFFFSACSQKSNAPAVVAMDALVLKNGGKIQCKIISETKEKIIVQYQDGLVDFQRSEIESILHGQQLVKTKDGIETQVDRDGGKIIQNYPYVRTTDGKVRFGKKLRKEGVNFILEKNDGEKPDTLPEDKIEKIFLWPAAERKTLSRDFQKMVEKFPDKIHDVDPYVVYSDVESSDFVLYRNAMEGTFHRFMTYFFELIMLDYKFLMIF